MKKHVDAHTEKNQKVESPYVHRFSAYLKDLEKNWAYVNTNKIPGVKTKSMK